MDSLKKQTRIHNSRLRALLAKNTNNRRCQKNSLFRAQTVFGLKYWKYSCFLNARSLQAEALDRDVLLVSILNYQLTLKRSGFALRPFPSHSPLSVQDFLPTLVKREDARSGFTVPILICTYKTHSI